jgi:hypothetical protein
MSRTASPARAPAAPNRDGETPEDSEAPRQESVSYTRQARSRELTGAEEVASAARFYVPVLHRWTPPVTCPACGFDGCECSS